MFSPEAISQAFSIWLGSAVVGLAFALLIALFNQRSGQAADAHSEHEAHGHNDHAHGDTHH
ncbi:MAG: hypothetical protein HND44_19600 [Chloroflexi bacterium]|nr:hypothetical protein [Ardenticatenaceae bacterium]MBL1130657.1 hypothetical protein [Chloroflexota bacterium]NOG36751.1 hypothetical protein [Chloroflexota bacterium]